MDTGFNPYHGADPWEYDLVLSNSEGGIGRLLESVRGGAKRCTGAPNPSPSAPQDVDKEVDVFFYGYGDKFRRDWMKTMIGEPSRLRTRSGHRAGRARLPGRHGIPHAFSVTCRSTHSRGRSPLRGSTST